MKAVVVSTVAQCTGGLRFFGPFKGSHLPAAWQEGFLLSD
jgi:hypothetical protein